jgi:hypothetical protein
MRRIKHRITPSKHRHWPFGIRQKSSLPLIYEVLALIVNSLQCTCGHEHSADEIAQGIARDFPALLINSNAIEELSKDSLVSLLAQIGTQINGIDILVVAEKCRQIAEALPRYLEPDPDHLDRISKHALLTGTHERILSERMEYCFLCGKKGTTGNVHWIHYGNHEGDQIPTGFCPRCEARPDQEERIQRELQYLAIQGICLCCGEKQPEHEMPVLPIQ